MKIFISHHIYRILLYLIVAVIVSILGVIIEPDTSTYVGFGIIAPPGYGIFLFVFRKLFGEDIYFHFIVFTQCILCFISCWYFIKSLKKVFDIDKKLLIVIDIILLAPIVIPEFLIANRIVTQGLAYPCFLFIIAFLIQTIFENRRTSSWLLLITISIGILIRPQFFFIIPVILLMLGYMLFTTRDAKRYGTYILILLTIPIITAALHKTFNYVIYERYANISSAGLLMMIPFYVADEEDYQIYEDIKTQEYYKYVYQIARDRKLLDDFYVPNNYNIYHHFDHNFVAISYGVLSKKGREFINPSDPNTADALIANDQFLKNMWFPLLKDNFWKCANIFYKNVIHAFGGFYMMYLCFLILLSSLYFYKKSIDKLALFSSILMLLTFSNILLICTVIHSIDRYLIYHQWMLPVLLVVLFNKRYKHMFKQPTS